MPLPPEPFAYLAPMFRALFALEETVATTIKDEEGYYVRPYTWRPTRAPELPAIWNWIDDADMEPVDTARDDDVIVIRATVATLPSDLEQTVDKLVVMTDWFRKIVDPVLKERVILPDPAWVPAEHDGDPAPSTARSARRIRTRSSIDEFDGTYAMCMDMYLRIQLSKRTA